MKKMLLSTVVLFLFSLSILVFQISCKKASHAAPVPASTLQQNKLLFLKFTSNAAEIWTANYDGSNQQKLNVTLPTNVVVEQDSKIKLSPDGKTIFFNAFTPGSAGVNSGIYSCNVDGSNAHLIIAGGTNGDAIGEAY